MFKLFPGYNATPMTELAMQTPMYHFSSPLVPDWDDDGVLDLWHHNHYTFSDIKNRWSSPGTEMKGNLKRFNGGCMADWDAVLRNGRTGNYYAPNNGDGFIEWSDKKNFQYCFDVHSSAFLDIDGDGYKDLFLVTGGAHGVGNKYWNDHLLFWGVPDDSSLGYRLVGGVETALAAGLNGRTVDGNERGRHQYWLDVDGDNLLDLIFLNDERADNAVIPGNLHRNVGGRKFQRINPKQSGFDEFATMALLTDIDGDGLAREIIVPSGCERRNRRWSPPKNYICDRSPKGYTSIYQLDPDSDGLMVRKSINRPQFRGQDSATSMVSGDFDFDGLADIAILWKKTISFYHSSKRQSRCKNISNDNEHKECLLTLGQADAQLDLKPLCGTSAAAIRLADFNLDGRIDMLVVCERPGMHGMYELMSDGTWKEMKKSNGQKIDLGDLNNPSLMLGKDFCNGIPTVPGGLPKGASCRKYFDRQTCRKTQYMKQFEICNLRAVSKNKPGLGAKAIGATVADIDNDGFSDVIVSYTYGSMVMLRNTFRDSGNKRFIAVRLDRTAGAAATIGAIVTATTSRMGKSSNEKMTQVRVISSLSHGATQFGGSDDRMIFGLGRRGKLVMLTIQWPHCCKPTVIRGNAIKAWQYYNKMNTPYEVPAPKNCDKSCL